MAPRSILIISIFHHFIIALLFTLPFILLCIFIPKILSIISIRSHSRKWPWRDWEPLIALVALSYLFCVGTRDSRVASYWIDTLVLKNWGKYLLYSTASPFPLQGNPTQCSRGCRKISGAVGRGAYAKVNIPSTHHNPLSLALHY